MIRNKEEKHKKELVKNQTYTFKDTVIKVQPVFKETGNRTLLHSLGQMIIKENNNS